MPDNVNLLERRQQAEAEDLARLLRSYAEALPQPERSEAFGSFFDRFADARVVLLGEATHGTSEFYRARAAITQRLIATHGFTIGRMNVRIMVGNALSAALRRVAGLSAGVP